MSKKEIVLFLLVFLSIMPFVSAYAYSGYGGSFGYGVSRGISWIEYNIGPYFDAILGGHGQFLFERILFFLIIFCLVFVILSRIRLFQDNMAVLIIVSLAVSLLATRFLGDVQMVKNLIVPYSVLGVVLTAGLPFVIFFFFVESFDTHIIRVVMWIFFCIVFFGVWAARYDELGDLAWIYFATGILSLIFLIFDGTIRRYMMREQMRQLGFTRRQQFEREVRRQMYETEQDLLHHIITPDQHRKIMKGLQDQMKAIRRN